MRAQRLEHHQAGGPHAGDGDPLAGEVAGHHHPLANTAEHLQHAHLPPGERSLGERQLLSPGTDIVDYARDRRVEFIFQDARGLDIIFEDQENDLQLEPTGGAR